MPFRSAKILFSADRKLYQSLKNILGFYPGNITLYKQAFRHRSAVHQTKEGLKASNERLEYLGDAVLSAVIAHYLFKKFPYKDEGFLTKMRSKIVSRTQLNMLAMKLGLDKFIESSVDGHIRNSILGDAFEALVGAIYLDKGYILASRFILKRILKHHIDIDEIETKEIDFKSKLIEWAQREKKDIKFSLIEEVGSGHEKQYLVRIFINDVPYEKAQHFSKKKAEQIAAEKTCTLLEI